MCVNKSPGRTAPALVALLHASRWAPTPGGQQALLLLVGLRRGVALLEGCIGLLEALLAGQYSQMATSLLTDWNLTLSAHSAIFRHVQLQGSNKQGPVCSGFMWVRKLVKQQQRVLQGVDAGGLTSAEGHASGMMRSRAMGKNSPK